MSSQTSTASSVSSFGRPHSFFGNSTTPSTTTTSSQSTATQKSRLRSSPIKPQVSFGKENIILQTPRFLSTRSKTDPSTTPATQPPANLFGVSNSQTPATNLFGSSVKPTKPPHHKSLFGSASIQVNKDEPNPFAFKPSTTVASPTPTRPRRLSYKRRSGYISPTTPPSPIRTPQSSASRSVCSGTPSSQANFTPISETQSPSRQEASNVKPPKSYVDPDGDLCLEVGHLSAEFVVCSKTMARSSPFWRKMLYGEFAEGKKAQTQGGKSSAWVVKLPEDNAAAMGIVLNIIHSRFDQIAGYEDFLYTTHLYNLCVLTDKYDMTHMLRPWARGWSRSTHAQCDKLGQSLRSKFCHERLWISWELGDVATFEEMATALLLDSSSSAGNNLRYVGALEPPAIYEKIERIRLDTTNALLKPLNDVVVDLALNNKSVCEHQSQEKKDSCAALMLGKAIQKLYSVGLWPLPQAATYSSSVASLVAGLQRVDFEDKPGGSHNCAQDHSRRLKEGIEKAVRSIPSLLNDAHRRHLEAQAKKSGFARPTSGFGTGSVLGSKT